MNLTEHLEVFKGNAYHYTNADALKSIIEGSNLYATNICFMNDSNEFWHSIEVAIEHIKALNTLHSCELYRRILSVTKSDLKNKLLNGKLLPYYVISFTESPDSASFLERYGNFNLGIEFGGVTKRPIKRQEQYFISARVIYSKKRQKKIIDDVLQDVDSMSLKELKESYWEYGPDYNEFEEINYRVNVFYNTIQFLSCWFKNLAYEDEKEVRIVAYEHMMPQVQGFRVKDNSIIPYMDVKIDRDWWEWDSILIGSMKYEGYQHIALKKWIEKKYENNQIKIKYSEAGHRLNIG